MDLHYYMAVDFGQASEATAWAVVERPYTVEPVYSLRHLQRFSLGTPFTRIVDEVRQGVAKLATEQDYPTLVIDQTGVGRPVVDLFNRKSLSASLVRVCISAGQQTTILEDGTRLVPKIELISCLQLLLQGRRLRVAKGMPATELLARELQNYRMKIVPANGDVSGWREHRDDDLVLAVALACWQAEREPPWGPDACSTGGFSVIAKMPREVSLTANLQDDDESDDR